MTESLPRRIKQAAAVILRGSAPAKQVRAEIPVITPEEVADARAFFSRDKFFIFGHARSGTTLLARLIRLHPEVHCNWQAHFFTRMPMLKSLVNDVEIEMWLKHHSNRWNHGGDLSPLVMRAAADMILERDAMKVGKRIVGDKSPSSVFHGEAVRNAASVYPDAFIINIVRDGRDTSLSHRFQGFVDRQDRMTGEDRQIRDDFVANPQPYLNGEKSIFTEKSLRQIAGSWVRNVSETESEGMRLFGDRFYHLRYEDLMASPWDEMCKIWRFLRVQEIPEDVKVVIDGEMHANPDAEWQAEKSSDLARLIPKGQQGSWQKLFTPRDKAIFKEIAGELLIQWKYEMDLEW